MDPLTDALAAVPAGRWAVAVSGGADSVALLRAMAGRGDCELVIVHLDHQLRGEESDGDAAFVAALAVELNVRSAIAKRGEWFCPLPLEGGGGGRGNGGRTTVDAPSPADLPSTANPSPQPSPPEGENLSAAYRRARYTFFADVVRRHDCRGVLLGHHADDQAETVLLRLLRGRGVTGLGGMAADTRLGGLRVLRPLLDVRRQSLRDFLISTGRPWREDSSNLTLDYRRNAARRLLAANPAWHDALLRLADASRALRARVAAASPPLGEAFAVADLPASAVAREWAVRQWLVARGAPADRVSPAVCRRLIEQALDARQPPRRHYPGGLLVRRRQRRVDVLPPAPVQSADTHGQETARAQDL